MLESVVANRQACAQKEFPWEREFLTSVDTLVAGGLTQVAAQQLIEEYIALSRITQLPDVLNFSHISPLQSSPFIDRVPKAQKLMGEIFKPLLSRFEISGLDHLRQAIEASRSCGLTLVANHLSLFDAAVIFCLLHEKPEFRKFAEDIIFIAGRLVFTADFSRVAGLMFRTMIVASPKDMAENPEIKQYLGRLNMRSYKEARARQKAGEALVLFPEGTRSRLGAMAQFHAGVLNYLRDTVVLPISLTGPDEILHANSFKFNLTSGEMRIAQPFYVGAPANAPGGLLSIPITKDSTLADKQRVMDTIGAKVAANLEPRLRGYYNGTLGMPRVYEGAKHE